MITPTRFGLKYAPIPTLALEYEDDLKTLDDGLSTTSLYVYSGNEKQHEQQQQPRRKKLHVVELPALTKHSEPMVVARQLQQDNRRFLAPDVVKEDQLVRLLERLMAHLQATELSVSSLPAVTVKEEDSGDAASGGGSMAGKFGSHASDDDDAESDLEQSVLDESIAEMSASMDTSKAEGSEEEDDDEDMKPKAKSEVGATISESAAIEAAAGVSAKPAGGSQPMKQSQEAQNDKDDDELTTASPAKTSKSEDDDREAEDVREAQEDAAKRRALKSESEASDDNEEDIQSEELEYFSEDASDEDSF